jgi:hypothetical protein
MGAERLPREGERVRASGVFAKGLVEGVTYTLRDGGLYMGRPTYEFVTARGRVAARFHEDDVERFMLVGRRENDHNGLRPVEGR